jgi:hypothetical protein
MTTLHFLPRLAAVTCFITLLTSFVAYRSGYFAARNAQGGFAARDTNPPARQTQSDLLFPGSKSAPAAPVDLEPQLFPGSKSGMIHDRQIKALQRLYAADSLRYDSLKVPSEWEYRMMTSSKVGPIFRAKYDTLRRDTQR